GPVALGEEFIHNDDGLRGFGVAFLEGAAFEEARAHGGEIVGSDFAVERVVSLASVARWRLSFDLVALGGAVGGERRCGGGLGGVCPWHGAWRGTRVALRAGSRPKKMPEASDTMTVKERTVGFRVKDVPASC